MNRTNYLLISGILLCVLLACQIDFGWMDQQTLETAAALTVEALRPTETPIPTATAVPTATQEPTATPQPTATPKPCNQAKFISETVPDGTDFSPNEQFTKTWRLENIGTCTWNANYRAVFFSGNQMSGPDAKKFSILVNPGEKVDVVLDLKAPSEKGEYKGVWKLQDDKGDHFGQIFVVIDVK